MSVSRSAWPGRRISPSTVREVAKRRAHRVGTGLARRGRRDELVALAEQQRASAGVHERAAALDHELEHALEVGLAAHGAGDRDGGLERR